MRRLSNARGAMLIQVGLSIMVLMGLTVFVFDNGLLWVARGQAQNAADAGALAGAVARAYDDFDDPPVAGSKVEQAATKTAALHEIWNVPGTSTVSYDCPPWITGGGCVQVDVFRNQENGSANLPQIFGFLMNVPSHGVRATATAQAIAANAASCLRPWAVADKWVEADGSPWAQTDDYEPAAGDVYTPPGPPPNYGTGFSNRDANGDPLDWGIQIALKRGNSGNNPGILSAGWSMGLDLPNDETPAYRSNISGCTSATVGIAPVNATCTSPDPAGGCIRVETGAMVGQATVDGVEHIMNTDPTAYWDRTANGGRGVIVTDKRMSGRIVPIAVFDPAQYLAQDCSGSTCVVKVVNFLGFFLEGFCKELSAEQKEPYLFCSPNQADIVGRLVTFPGVFHEGGPTNGPASFGMIIRLVR